MVGPMRIDLHAHVLTPRFAKALEPTPVPLLPHPPDALRSFMDRFEISASVVSMLSGTPVTSAEVARIGNEELAELIRDQPDRLGGLAILPITWDSPDRAIEEVEYGLDVLGLDGVQLLSCHDGRYLGDPSFEDLFAELNRRKAYATVHPVVPRDGWPLDHPVWLYEFTFETTRAMANLIYSGVFERYPDIRLQFAHLGGTTPFLSHRIASLATRDPDQATQAPAGALEYLHRQYYDTGLANNKAALASTLEVASGDHIVFGTDWPYLYVPDDRKDPSEDFELIDPLLRDRIESKNALALVPRLAERLAA